MKTRKIRETATAVLALIPTFLARLIASAQPPSITVTPQAFTGSQALVQFLDYAMYAAWLFVIGLIIYAVFEMREGALSPGVKKALGGAIAAAFLLTFGWAIISGVF